MDTLQKVLEFSVKILGIITWPIVTLIIFLILREPLKNFINNIKKIGYGSAGIETEQSNKQADDDEKSPIELLTKGASNKAIDKAISLFSDETMEEFKKAVIKETLLDNFNTPIEKLEILLKYSQLIYLIMHFGKIYNSIYGSQLSLLQRLNSSIFENKDTLKPFYDFAKSTFPKTFEGYTYENYLDYLISFNLILVETGGTIKITIFGRDFLKYIIETGLAFEKLN
jgi:hypothetical protein